MVLEMLLEVIFPYAKIIYLDEMSKITTLSQPR